MELKGPDLDAGQGLKNKKAPDFSEAFCRSGVGRDRTGDTRIFNPFYFTFKSLFFK